MIDRSVSASKIEAGVLWGLVILLILGAWAVAFVHWQAAILVGVTACALSAGAATMQIRCYVIRVCALLRRQAPPVPREDGLHSV